MYNIKINFANNYPSFVRKIGFNKVISFYPYIIIKFVTKHRQENSNIPKL